MHKPSRTLILWLLTLVYIVSFIDRQIIGILSPSIKKEMGFDDWQLGLLKGFGFALLYTLIGIPIAWLADRYSRAKIITVSLTLWSGFTALTGMAGNFGMMLLARTGVGIGEAGCSPPAHSIISDLYPKEQRASALGIYSLGIPIGIAFSFILAGLLAEKLGWRGTLIALGIVGVLLAAIILLVVKEPRRGQMESGQMESGQMESGQMESGQIESQDAAIKPVNMSVAISTLARIPSWWAMCLGTAWVSFGGYAVANWGVDYIMRVWPEFIPNGPQNRFKWLMMCLGLIHLFGYGAGTYFGALITEKLARKNISAYGLMPGMALCIGFPVLIAGFWTPSIYLHLICLATYLICAGFYLGPSFATAQTLAPVNMRAMSTALFFLILNIIALGGGPTYIGWMSERLIPIHGEAHALRLALSTLILPYIVSILCFFIAAKTLPKDWAEAAGQEAEAKNWSQMGR